MKFVALDLLSVVVPLLLVGLVAAASVVDVFVGPAPPSVKLYCSALVLAIHTSAPAPHMHQLLHRNPEASDAAMLSDYNLLVAAERRQLISFNKRHCGEFDQVFVSL